MKLDWAMLADAAEIRENLAFVLAGGIDTVNAASLPAMFHGAVLVRLLVHRSEIDHPHRIEVRFVDEDGKELVKAQGSVAAKSVPGFPVGWDYPVFLALNIAGMPLTKAGRYSVEILGDGSYLQTLNFRVVLRDSSATLPPPAISQ